MAKTSIEVKIDGITDVYTFVKLATAMENKVTVTRGDYVVDGKSILGLIAINPAEGVTVTLEDELSDAGEAFKDFLFAHSN